MFKRPLLISGAGAVLISLIMVAFFPHLIFPESDITAGSRTSFECKIKRIEEKENSLLLYVRRGREDMLITASKDLQVTGLKTGNTIDAECTFLDWKRARNRGNFDEQNYYRSLGIYQKYKLNSFRITDSSYSVIGEMLRALRSRLSESIRECADEETAGILDALLTGYRSSIDEETMELFRMSGIAHVLAISGLHVSFIGTGSYRILRKKFRYSFSAAVSLLIVLCYVIMTSGSASSVRAFIMMAAELGATGLGRKYDMLSALNLALMLLLISNPFYVSNPGFILSFCAVASIAVISGPVAVYVAGEKPAKMTGLLYRFARTLSFSLSVSAATLPVILNMYYEFPLPGPVINMAILYIIPFIFAGTLFGSLAGMIFKPAGRFIMGLPVFLTRGINAFCRWITEIDGTVITTGHRSAFNIIIYYSLVILVIVLLKICKTENKTFKAKDILRRTAVMMVIYVVLVSTVSVKIPSKDLNISFLDVDQGESILITDGAGRVFLVDAGSSSVKDVYKYRIKSTLKYKGIDTIDYLIVTHPDTDHVSGVIEMMDQTSGRMTVKELLIPEFDENENYIELVRLAHLNGIPVTGLGKGVSINDRETELLCIHPYADKEYPGTNEKSAVMQLRYGSFKALLTGDISSEQEMDLVRDSDADLDCDLLDVPHHGSRYSSCEVFLDKASPEIACISAGVNNSYGHPHEETLVKLEGSGAETYCTNELGEIDVTVSKDGDTKVICMGDAW